MFAPPDFDPFGEKDDESTIKRPQPFVRQPAGPVETVGRPGRPPEPMGSALGATAGRLMRPPQPAPGGFSGSPGPVMRPKWDTAQQFNGRTFGAQPLPPIVSAAGEQFQRQIRPMQPGPVLPDGGPEPAPPIQAAADQTGSLFDRIKQSESVLQPPTRRRFRRRPKPMPGGPTGPAAPPQSY